MKAKVLTEKQAYDIYNKLTNLHNELSGIQLGITMSLAEGNDLVATDSEPTKGSLESALVALYKEYLEQYKYVPKSFEGFMSYLTNKENV